MQRHDRAKSVGGWRLAIVALASALLAAGCIFYPEDGWVDSPYHGWVVNYAPVVVSAEAGCYWDPVVADHIWYFDAFVSDADGLYDVDQVWAHVYDELGGGVWLDSFELYPTADPMYWTSEWYESSTRLACGYEFYSVDFVAFDAWDHGIMSVVPY